MRPTRRAMTVRRLMIAVVLVALAFPIVRLVTFYRKHLHASLAHRESERYYALQLQNLALTEFAPSVSPERRRALMDEWIARARNRERYHAELKRKYERAATHPWDALEPDPPEPE